MSAPMSNDYIMYSRFILRLHKLDDAELDFPLELRLVKTNPWTCWVRGAKCGRQAQTIATQGSIVDQMNIGPMSQVASIAWVKRER